ncbi:MAG: PQQ-like beta-propeller repeat protein [Armatimonadetes bacterium]|jgi:outer membrane protein assembly factor BamB|nr:PQQ-like beta-propeller repeat protein [Armatimonadota bacterium]
MRTLIQYISLSKWSKITALAGLMTCLIAMQAPAVTMVDPLFPNYRGDEQRTGRALRNGPAAPTNVIRVDIGKTIHSSPAIGVDGTAYFGSTDKNIYAVSATGDIMWSYLTGNIVMSSPVIDPSGNIYIGSLDGYMYALDSSGALKWRASTSVVPGSPTTAVYSSPIVTPSGSLVFAALNGYIFSLDVETGAEQWRYNTGTTMMASAAVSGDGEYLYIGGTDGKLRCLSSDGQLQWEHQAIDKINTAPAIADDGSIYATSADGYLYCINPDGSLRWKTASFPNLLGSPAIGIDGTAYFGTYDGYMLAISTTGKRLWTFRTAATIKSSPVIDISGNLFFGNVDGMVYSVDSVGQMRWSLNVGSEVSTTTAIGDNGTLYFGLQNGTFCIINDGLIYHTPEPSAFVVLLSGMSGVALMVRRRKSKG